MRKYVALITVLLLAAWITGAVPVVAQAAAKLVYERAPSVAR